MSGCYGVEILLEKTHEKTQFAATRVADKQLQRQSVVATINRMETVPEPMQNQCE